MKTISLPPKYLFNEKSLEGYKPGDKLPPLELNESEFVFSVSEQHPLAEFMQFYIDNVLSYLGKNGVLDNVVKPAWRERSYLNSKASVPQLLPPSLKEMKEKGYFGAIKRLELYNSNLESAIKYSTEKGIPNKILNEMIGRQKQVKEGLQRILEAEGKPDCMVIRLG